MSNRNYSGMEYYRKITNNIFQLKEHAKTRGLRDDQNEIVKEIQSLLMTKKELENLPCLPYPLCSECMLGNTKVT